MGASDDSSIRCFWPWTERLVISWSSGSIALPSEASDEVIVAIGEIDIVTVRLTKGLSHAARQALDQGMEEVKRSLLVRAGGL